MKFSWHLLFEQLQRNPERLEEAPEPDPGAEEPVSQEILDPRDRELLAIRRLQRQLGNRGLQRLIDEHGERLSRRARIRSATAQQASEPAPESPGQAITRIRQDDGAGSAMQLAEEIPTAEAAPEEQSLLNAADATETETAASEANRDAARNNGALEDKADILVDPAHRLASLLPIFIVALPQPALDVWQALSEIYPRLESAKQVRLVDTLAARVRSLPPAARHRFVLLMRELPAAIAKAGLAPALLARLLRHGEAATAPEAPPAPET